MEKYSVIAIVYSNIAIVNITITRILCSPSLNTYPKVRGHCLSPHVGGLPGVTHHLHRVHLHTETETYHCTYHPGHTLPPNSHVEITSCLFVVRVVVTSSVSISERRYGLLDPPLFMQPDTLIGSTVSEVLLQQVSMH